MQVMINGKLVDYFSDFDPVDIQSNVKRNWKVSAGDYFKFPVSIDNTICFVKRFDRKDIDISGYTLLHRLKGKKLTGLPFIYDLVRVREGNKEILYLFTEYLPGSTLEDLQRKGFHFLPEKLASDLYTALHNIHQQGFWFPDFDPKNLYRANNGNFYLIDLDSTYPLEELPKAKMFGSKDYWAPVYNCYRQKMGLTSEEIKQLKGDAFNTLHLLYFLCLYSFFLHEDGEDLSTTTIERITDHYYPKYKLFESTLRYCFSKNPNTGQLYQKPLTLEILFSFVNTYLFPGRKEVYLSKQRTNQKPVVQFGVKGNRTVYQPGEIYQLQWNTSNVDSLTLDAEPQPLSGSKSVVSNTSIVHKLRIGFKQKGVLKNIDYPITIKVEPKPELTLTAIFTRTRANKPAKLRWEVKNGKNIDLLLNGQIYKSNCANTGSLDVTLPFDYRTAGIQRSTLQLAARSLAEGIEYRSAPVQIEVVKPVKFHLGWMIIPALIIGIIWIVCAKACSGDEYALSNETSGYPAMDSAAAPAYVDTTAVAVDSTAALTPAIDTTKAVTDHTAAVADSTAAPAYTDNATTAKKEIEFYDNFSDNSNGWHLTVSPNVNVEITGGNLSINVFTDGGFHTGQYFPIDTEKFFTVSSRMGRGDLHSTGSYGIYFSDPKYKKCHLFYIQPGGNYGISTFENEDWKNMTNGNSEYILLDNNYNTLRISKFGDYYFFYANSHLLTTSKLDMSDIHYFGIYAESYNTNVSVEDFSIKGESIY